MVLVVEIIRVRVAHERALRVSVVGDVAGAHAHELLSETCGGGVGSGPWVQ